MDEGENVTEQHDGQNPGDRAGIPGSTLLEPVPAPFPGPVAARTNTLSIVSLVTAFVCSLAAVITGHIALSQIKRTGEAGRGLAIAGLVLGYVGIVFTTLLVILVAVFAATFGLLSTSPAGTSSPGPAIDASGLVGAAHLDDGYLQAGAGATVVDLYLDPMCPYCGQFEVANGDTLAALVDDGSISLRVHSLTFLDRASQGTQYSTRASGALTCEAAINPDSTLDYLAALFATQPAEGTTGLSNDELVALSSGADSIAACVDNGEYEAWSQQNTDDALTGPLPGAEIDSIQGTPTVLVDGSPYQGPLDDPQQFTEFVVGATA